jgi:hypothetical protein
MYIYIYIYNRCAYIDSLPHAHIDIIYIYIYIYVIVFICFVWWDRAGAGQRQNTARDKLKDAAHSEDGAVWQCPSLRSVLRRILQYPLTRQCRVASGPAARKLRGTPVAPGRRRRGPHVPPWGCAWRLVRPAASIAAWSTGAGRIGPRVSCSVVRRAVALRRGAFRCPGGAGVLQSRTTLASRNGSVVGCAQPLAMASGLSQTAAVVGPCRPAESAARTPSVTTSSTAAYLNET